MTTSISTTKTADAQTWQPKSPLTGGIVVAVDGSPESVAALETARLFSERKGWPVHIISVLPSFASYRLDGGIDQPESEIEALRIQLREVALRDLLHSTGADSDWSREVLVGRPARVIAEVAGSRGADLLIVGRRHHGLERIVGGETTLQVMRVSSVPVLAVGSRIGAIDSVVVATDFSAASERAARAAINLMSGSGTLYLAYVEPPVDLLPDGFSRPDDRRHPGDVVAWFRKMTAELDAPRGIVVEPVLLNGKPVPAILEFAERTGVQLIAAGSHGHTRLERFLLGSVSTGLVRNASVGVLVTPVG